MKKKATLADVAAAAGVSKMTASRALRGVRDVSKINIARVREAAQELGYVGNFLAASLSSQRSDLIGVVVPNLTNIVFAQVLSGISEGIAGSGVQPVFGVTDYDLDKEYDIIRNMLSWQPAGLIVTGLDLPEQTRRLLENAEIPVVQIMDVDGDPVDACVGFSHIRSGEEIAQALLGAGLRKFGYAGCALTMDVRAAKRRIGFQRALIQNGLDFVEEVEAFELSSIAAGRSLTEQLLTKAPDLDCIYYSNDDVAAGGLFYCIEAGIAVPDQVALAGFNGLSIASGFPGRIATVRTPRREIGKQAAGIICSALEGKVVSGTSVELVPQVDLGLLEGRRG
ncbi:LacI family DNA-binding transcriptional regulator [Roseibium litorale]|uniref:LacI family DNA-binding transcriptional regulator n=1 Tax=Roseibium litorale TaxID=2803841 RepID=A0ABR9CM69_9HYPH|nr:LacI family DNA-binding transcriptional regulator [Roseibium litorale]MBD8891945.1 LacI family DNA-binding transcriptional regulator [Roseibium litorale]